MKKVFFVLIYFLLGCCCLHAQQLDWRTYLEQQVEEGMDEYSLEQLYEELEYRERHPFNLNTVTKEELEGFPLLTVEQVESLLRFLSFNRPIYTVYELRNVFRFDYYTASLVLPFFEVGEMTKKPLTFKQRLKYSQHDVQLRWDKTLQQRAGYADMDSATFRKYPNRQYRGEDFYTSFRYSVRSGNQFQAGFTAEKDAGEPLFRSKSGFDHYGFHMLLKNVGIIKTIALGDYRLSFGQGLVMNTEFKQSKAWFLGKMMKITEAPKRHFSTAESGYLRGGAMMLGKNDFRFTSFYSNQRVDASLSDKGEITSIKTDGLHRTIGEIEKRKNTRAYVMGGNIDYRNEQGYQIGASVVYYAFNRRLNPPLADYNKYYLRDYQHLNASVDYSIRRNNWNFSGETAVDRHRSVATVNSFQYRPGGDFMAYLLYRHYPASYNALYSRAFSDGSKNQNEQGVYLGMRFAPLPKLMVDTYVDYAYFPWKRFGVGEPSRMIEWYVLSTYHVANGHDLVLRYRYKQRQENDPESSAEGKLRPTHTHKVRLRYLFDTQNGITTRTTADIATFAEHKLIPEMGFMVSQNVRYETPQRWRIDGYVGYFNAPSFDTRLYSYERNILNTFYIPSFYGQGMRLSLSARYNLTESVSFSLKLGNTSYFNKREIGTGNETIYGAHRTDIYTYLRWRF